MTILKKVVVNKKYKKQREVFETISFIIFGDFSMFYQIFFSPQVDR